MECQDATAHIADYLAGSLPVEELEGLLTHAAACAACRDKLTETWRQLGRIPPADSTRCSPTTRMGSAAVREPFAAF